MMTPGIDPVLFALEEAMHYHCDQPLKVDAMSLTRHWREILEEFREQITAPLRDALEFYAEADEDDGGKVARATLDKVT